MTTNGPKIEAQAREMLAPELSKALGKALLEGHPCGHHTITIATALRALVKALSIPSVEIRKDTLTVFAALLLDYLNSLSPDKSHLKAGLSRAITLTSDPSALSPSKEEGRL